MREAERGNDLHIPEPAAPELSPESAIPEVLTAPPPVQFFVKLKLFCGDYDGPVNRNCTLPHGEGGTMHYKNGNIYSGSWMEGQMHGSKGSMEYAKDGAVYTGGWSHGKYEGIGNYVDASSEFD
eukprot:gene3452-4441_t